MRGEGVHVPLVDLEPQHREIAGELTDAWNRVLHSGQYVGGPELDRFENDWAAYCSRRHAVGVANGTDALLLTLRSLGIGAGDEVVVPTNTFIATAEAVVLAGATPRFADVDPDTLLITPEMLAAATTPRTAAVIVVHLYGHVPDMDALTAAAQASNIALIEDAAQAHGATWDGRPAGSFGVAGCFSFYPTKNLGALGDGGAIVTDDASLAGRIRQIADHGRERTDRDAHSAIGTNSRLDAVQAAILRAKLPHLDRWTESRREIAAAYRERLTGSALRPVDGPDGCESAYHLFVARVDDRSHVRSALSQRGIQTGIHYPVPCHRQEPYSAFADEPLPNAERAAREILSLPLFPSMAIQHVEEVAEALAAAAGRAT